METLSADVRYGLRSLAQKPGVTAAALLTLAFGIGANTSIFSVVNAVVLRPLPYRSPEELVMVFQDHTRLDGPATEWASPDNFFDWRDQNGVFDGTFALGGFGPTLTGAGEPEQLRGALVSHDALAILGIEPLHGRSFRRDEDRSGAERVVLLAHSLWQRRFGGDAGVLGTAITLDEKPATIVGVLPAELVFPVLDSPDIFAPLAIDASNSCGRGCVTLRVVARMKSGVTLERARSDLQALGARLERDYPEHNQGVGITVVPLHEQLVGFIRPALVLLVAAVGLVLLMACANVASLMLARASDREREVATRMAMGASRSRLFRQFLTENMLLALVGAGLGVVVALWGVDVLRGLIAENVPRLSQVRVDSRVLSFTTAIAVLTGLVFGLAPALRASKPDLASALKEGSRGLTASKALRVRAALVVAQVALALAILVGASLLARSFSALTRVDPGFDPANVLTGRLNLSGSRYDEAGNRVAFVDRLVERLRALPGVVGAAAVSVLPMGGNDGDAGFLIEGRAPPEPNRGPVAWYRSASAEYFSTMRIELARGRIFAEGDDAASAPVVLINETAVRRYWPNDDPLLSRIRIGGAWRQVIGVVADTKHFGLAGEDRPALYFPYDQMPFRAFGLVVRGSGPPEELTAIIRETVRELDSELPLAGVGLLEDVVSENVSTPRMTTVLFALFGGLALGLAAVGLYGVLSETVAQTRREIGIRMALGARGQDVRRAVLGRGLVLLLAGTAVGFGASISLSRLLGSLLFGVTPGDPTAFVAAGFVLSVVAIGASYLPARRASRLDPIVALRYE